MILALFLGFQDGQEKLLATFREEFVPITPGKQGFPATFQMGSTAGEANERPVHRVTFKYSFSVAKFELPQNVWQSVMGENPSRWKGVRNSVEMVSFDEALDFCARVTKLLRTAKLIEPDEIVRLPSEAEWEYAARAGTETRYSFGHDAKDLGDFAWYTGNAAGNDPPVGAKKPNSWKLHDVHGYLWEWCADAWHGTYEGAPSDGRVWPGDAPERRVLRGGSWKDAAGLLTSSYRRAAESGLRDDAVGLRCVLATPTSP